MYWNRRLTRLEAGLYATIAAILVVFLSERLLQTFEIAERTAMETTVMNVNSALNSKAALEMIRGQRPDGWERRNPFELAQVTPQNLLEGGLDSIRPGTWVFDAASAEVVYLPRFHSGLAVPAPDGMLRFRLTQTQSGVSYMLVPTSKYAWN